MVYLNVVGYKGGYGGVLAWDRRRVYLNVVGYKVTTGVNLFDEYLEVYLNVVGYKDLLYLPVQQTYLWFT